MALEAGTYISDLVPTNPTGTDNRRQGDDHLRLLKSTILNTFPNINGAVTATDEELNILDGVTATTAELNILDGVTATAAEINKLDGVTADTAELNKLDGLLASTAELNFMQGVSSNVQTQLNTNGAAIAAVGSDLDALELTAVQSVNQLGTGEDVVSKTGTILYGKSLKIANVTNNLPGTGSTSYALSISSDSTSITVTLTKTTFDGGGN